MGAFERLQDNNFTTSLLKEEKEKMSIKYQVLCDETAIIGVMKQENKTTGEMQETTIKLGKSELEME